LNSPALDARAAARQLEEAVDNVTKSIKENGHTLDIHTEKGRANQAALDGVAEAANKQIGALQANGASQKTLQSTLNTSRDRLIKTAEKFGMSKGAAKAYADQVLKIPPAKQTTITVKGVTAATQAVETLRLKIAGLNGKTVTITQRVVNTTAGSGAGSSTQGGITRADGGPVYGEGTATSDSIPAWLSNGEFVVKASAVSKYGTGFLHAVNDMRFANGGFVGAAKFAGGGEVDYSAIMAILSDVTDYGDVRDARANRTSKAAAYASARNALASLVAQQRKAARDLAAARRNKDHDRVSDILDRQRVLLGKVAAAEGKVTAARNASAAAAKSTLAVEKAYTADRRPMIDRAMSATWGVNKTSKAFLDNIDKLTKMGFKSLALELLTQGGAEAETIAAQAVKSASKARSLQSAFTTSANLSKRAAAMEASLNGTAVSSQNLISPTWRGPGHQVNSYSYEITAYGNDAEAATRRAMANLDYQMAVKL